MVNSPSINLKYQEGAMQQEELPIFIKDHKNPKIMHRCKSSNIQKSRNP